MLPVKKPLLRILVCVCLLLALFACSSATEQESFSEINYDESSGTDFAGAVFTFGSGWAKTQWYPEIGFTYATDMQRDRFNSVKEKFGCEFSVVVMDDSTGTTFQYIAAGIPTTDIWDGHVSNTGRAFYQANILLPLNSIETIDSTDESKWGPYSFRSYGIFDGASYGFYTWQWQYLIPQFAGTLLFNEQIIKRFALEEPYELQERGVWNWDNFATLLDNSYHNVTTEGFIPFTINESDHIVKTFVFSNGLDYIVSSGNSLEFGFNSPHAADAVLYLKDLYDRQLYRTSGGYDAFIADKALFVSCESYWGTYTNNEKYAPNCMDDFGFISFPYGPNGDPSTVSSFVHWARRLNYFLAYGENDPDDVGTVCDYVFSYLDGEDSGWEQWSRVSIFHYEQGWENMMAMCRNMKYDYSAQLSKTNSSVINALSNAVTGKETPAEALGRVTDAVNNDILENLTWVYEPGKTY